MATFHLRVKDDTKRNGSKVSPKRHADYILREEGQAHADYINREGAQSDKSDCVFKGSQLPKWAKGSPQKFFSAATRYEDKGNCRYKEIEMSLPNELSLEQNRLIVDRFIANHLANHYYAYAIHEKAGELSGERHPHVHIMFSERIIDDVERNNERPACKYFRKAAKPLRGEQVASFERRRQHGAPKDKKWHSKKYFHIIREDCARIQNKVLAQNGFSIRVDPRTLQAQQVVAEGHGDEFLAKLYKRMPESYIGVVPIHKKNELVADIKRFREEVQSRQHSLFLADVKRKVTEEGETQFLISQAESASSAFMNSTAYKSANMDDKFLRTLNQEILAGLTRISDLKGKLVGYERARQQALKEYLTTADHQFICDYESNLQQRDDLERLLKELVPPSDLQQENTQAFRAITRGVEKKISDLRTYLAQQNQKYWAIQEKLQNPFRRKNFELVVHGILQNDLDILRELKKTSTAVLHNVQALREKLEVHEMPKTTFTAQEIRDLLREQYLSLKTQYKNAENTRNRLMFQRISPSSALSKAKNLFVHGAFEKLHSQLETYEKSFADFKRDLAEFHKHELFLNTQPFSNNGEKLRHQYYLTKEHFQLEAISQKLAETKIQMDEESTRLKTLCQTEQAQEQIALLAADILHHNLKIVQEYETAKKTMSILYDKIQLAKKRFKAFDSGYSRLKKNYVYRVIPSETNSDKTSTSSKNELVTIIADALLAEPYAVPLVARLDGNFLEMEKDWELMSDLDKDELIQKQIVREL